MAWNFYLLVLANFEDIYENRKLIVVIDLHAIVIEIYMFDDFT